MRKIFRVVAAAVLLRAVATASRGALSYAIADYDFTYPVATSDFNNAPLYIFDSVGDSFFTGNPNVVASPEAQDLTPHNRDLFADFRRNTPAGRPPSSSDYARYVTSTVASGGTGNSGVIAVHTILQTSSAGTGTPSTFANAEFSRGFKAIAHIEVNATTISGLPNGVLWSLNNMAVAIAQDDTNPNASFGVAYATIAGTFGTRLKGTSNLLRTGSSRPVHTVEMWYDPLDLIVPGNPNDLFLVIDGVTEAEGNFALNTGLDNGLLNVLGTGGFHQVLGDVMLTSFTFTPEPASGAALMTLACLTLRRRR